MTRNGKIARLPRSLRDQLNHRLADNEPGKDLVRWLNTLPEVRAVLAVHFGARPITEQNLSEWKTGGGYQDWLRHQDALESLRTAAEESRELATQTAGAPVADVISASITVLLARLIREMSAAEKSTPQQRRELLALVREWSAVRKGDHRSGHLAIARDRWAATRPKLEAQADIAARTASQEQAWEPVRWMQKDKLRQTALADLLRHLPPAEATRLDQWSEAVRWPAFLNAKDNPAGTEAPRVFRLDPTGSNRKVDS